MTVFVVEIEYAVQCDMCGEFDNKSVFLKHDATIRNAKKDFKERGWTFKGSCAICPKCKNSKMEQESE